MGQEILFEVSYDRYQNTNVGSSLSGKNIEPITVEQVNKSLNFIKMQYMNNRTNELVTATLDTVFKKMVDYFPLFPDDATKWSFCLPSMFYNSLIYEIKTDIQIQDYQIPQPSLIPTKNDQLQNMFICRSMTGQAIRKVKQVKASVAAIISNQITRIKDTDHNFLSTPVYSYNPLSRTEDTMKREYDKKRRI